MQIMSGHSYRKVVCPQLNKGQIKNLHVDLIKEFSFHSEFADNIAKSY